MVEDRYVCVRNRKLYIVIDTKRNYVCLKSMYYDDELLITRALLTLDDYIKSPIITLLYKEYLSR